MITVSVNNQPVQVAAQTTLASALPQWRRGDAPVAVAVDMHGDLVGNFTRGVLHGGVISTCLDVAGGLAAFREVAVRMSAAPVDEVAARFSRIGTIDLRVDYLRPGLGRRFTATAHIMRHGNKVAVARMELHNERGQLIAAGTGAYVVA